MNRRMTLVATLALTLAADAATWRVTDFGAIGDGTTPATAAFQQALNACADSGGGEVVVPAGTFLIGSVFIGPNTTLRIEKDATIVGSPNKDDYPLTAVRWEGRWRLGHRALLYAVKSDHIAVVGEGAIAGDAKLGYLRDPRGPCLIEAVQCRNVRLEGISLRYERMWTVHLAYCQAVIARGLNIRTAPRPSNGDGIDVDSSKDLLIDHCDIDTGDDAIAIKSGRGAEAVQIGRPTENVTIRNCRLGSTFAGIGIGTEMSGGVRNVHIENCTFTRGVNAIYIKSRTGRGGFIENVTGENLVNDGPRHFLHIDLLTKGIVDSQTIEGLDGLPRVSNIRFRHIQLRDCQTLLSATRIDPRRPVVDLELSDVTGSCERGIELQNLQNVTLRDIHVTGFRGPLIAATNVTGTGIPASQPATTESAD